MAHVLVTGGAGYIGCILVRKLMSLGYRVTALDRFFFGQNGFAGLQGSENLILKKADIRDLTPADFEGVDAVCDLAALSNDPSGDLDPELTKSINVSGRVHVARCARDAGVKRYILSSSCSVYGHGDSDRMDETHRVNPLTVYAKSSYEAELRTREFESSEFVWSALRNATVFGLSPRMRFDLVINLMTLNAVEKGKIFVLGGGKQWRPLVHIEDVAGAFAHLIAQPKEQVAGEVFNLGLANYQILSLAYIVRETLPFRIEVEVAPDDADKRDYQVSFDKLAAKLGYTPEVSVADGVREIYDAIKMGRVSATPETSTVGWYKTIIAADKLIERVKLNGRLI